MRLGRSSKVERSPPAALISTGNQGSTEAETIAQAYLFSIHQHESLEDCAAILDNLVKYLSRRTPWIIMTVYAGVENTLKAEGIGQSMTKGYERPLKKLSAASRASN